MLYSSWLEILGRQFTVKIANLHDFCFDSFLQRSVYIQVYFIVFKVINSIMQI